MKCIIISAVWCNGCLKMRKVWKQLEEKFSMISFQYFDYDMDEECQNYKIGQILPVMILEIEGIEKKRWIGEIEQEKLEKEIQDEITQ